MKTVFVVYLESEARNLVVCHSMYAAEEFIAQHIAKIRKLYGDAQAEVETQDINIEEVKFV